jgi:type III secretion system chaperone SycN
MTNTDTAVQDFGAVMGMPKLAFNENGVVRLRFEKTGTLSIERTDRGAMLQLARPADSFRDGFMERALALCHSDQADRLRPDAGISRSGALVFSVVLDETVIDLPSLEEAFGLLRRLHDRVDG